MKARRFEISRARFERPMMKDTWQLLNEFIMVCSWDLIMNGFTEKFWAWKQESDNRNWFSFVALFEGPANVCGTHTFVFTGASGATVVVASVENSHSLFLSTGVFLISFGYCTGESSLPFLVGFIVIVKRLYASVTCDLHNLWTFNICLL